MQQPTDAPQKMPALIVQKNKLFDDYDDYLYAQIVEGKSLESWSVTIAKAHEFYADYFLKDLDKNIIIGDFACGDGTSLKIFKKMGIKNAIGIELEKEKASLASQVGYPVLNIDLQKLSNQFGEKYFDVIFSAHTLEHLYDPIFCLKKFHQFLKDDGYFFLVLPYGADTFAQELHKVHCACHILGLTQDDSGHTLINILEKNGFKVLEVKFDNFRESEIWLKLIKN
ncbi:MAG TPA: class I SAM-dependent methyltransferase [Chlamydiales bacterium]|nr:class I SAM-dependent methyltransferase [Chlamydiales bacterium]